MSRARVRPMGRLFWKFFAFVWLAQLAGIIAVGTLFIFTGPHATPDGRHDAPTAVTRPDHGGPAPPPYPPPHRVLRGFPPPIALFATLAASIVTAMLLAWYVAKPIRSLRSAFQAVAAGHFDRRIATQIGPRNDELADLGRDFDLMAAQLQTSMEGQRRLLHDVSHELRSPLARLQAAVGLIRQGSEQPPALITRIEDETNRIDRLVGELLALSRLESGEFLAVDEEVDMHELVEEIVRDANFEAQRNGREVIWTETGSATLRGRADLLHSAIENIVRNALKHAAGSPKVWIETAADAVHQHYTLSVLDSGPGIAPEELPKLFTPFYRGANTPNSDSYGLGMAIARRCVEAHGGTIRAANREGGGLRVEIVLPWRDTQPGSSA